MEACLRVILLLYVCTLAHCGPHSHSAAVEQGSVAQSFLPLGLLLCLALACFKLLLLLLLLLLLGLVVYWCVLHVVCDSLQLASTYSTHTATDRPPHLTLQAHPHVHTAG